MSTLKESIHHFQYLPLIAQALMPSSIRLAEPILKKNSKKGSPESHVEGWEHCCHLISREKQEAVPKMWKDNNFGCFSSSPEISAIAARNCCQANRSSTHSSRSLLSPPVGLWKSSVDVSRFYQSSPWKRTSNYRSQAMLKTAAESLRDGKGKLVIQLSYNIPFCLNVTPCVKQFWNDLFLRTSQGMSRQCESHTSSRAQNQRIFGCRGETAAAMEISHA